MVGEVMTKHPGSYHPRSYGGYLAGNSWHCPNAPINPDIPLQVQHNTGAHYWLPFPDGSGRWYCKYCYTLRRFRNIKDGDDND